MTANIDVSDFYNFDVDQSEASLWVFKKRRTDDQLIQFTAASVLISDSLASELKLVVQSFQSDRRALDDYTLLSQVSEGGFLVTSSESTLFLDLKGLVDRPLEECLARNNKKLNNSAGYVFRLRCGDKIIYCVKKASSDWTTRKKRGVMNVFFKDAELDIAENPTFCIYRSFDFFVVDDAVLISDKSSFESLLHHNNNYGQAYADLKADAAFTSVISNINVLDSFVGNNATHLRRMSVIQTRGYYRDPNYMDRLRQVNNARGWGIRFDSRGRIVATPDKMRDIVHVLLDHRLHSELSDNQYDVPSTTPVG